MKPMSYALVPALALLLGACGDDRSDSRQTPPAAQSAPQGTPPQSTAPRSGTSSAADTAPFSAMENMPPECDMQSHDMAGMTEDERRGMEADCEAAKRRGAAGETQPPPQSPPR